MKNEFLPPPAGFKMSEERRPKVELRTFREWSEAGYQILKGSKRVDRDAAGIALFSSEQVSYVGGYVGELEDGDENGEFDPDLPGNPADYGDR